MHFETHARSCTVTNKSRSLTYNVASSFVFTSPFAVVTFVVVLDTRTVSSSAEFKSFLLVVCMKAPESAIKHLFSVLIDDGAGRQHSSEGEKNVALL